MADSVSAATTSLPAIVDADEPPRPDKILAKMVNTTVFKMKADVGRLLQKPLVKVLSNTRKRMLP